MTQSVEEELLSLVDDNALSLSDQTYVSLMNMCGEHRRIKNELLRTNALLKEARDSNRMFALSNKLLIDENTLLRASCKQFQAAIHMCMFSDSRKHKRRGLP